jgi:hypothetical protein
VVGEKRLSAAAPQVEVKHRKEGEARLLELSLAADWLAEAVNRELAELNRGEA